jgi:DNA-binding NtrC family response regulator
LVIHSGRGGSFVAPLPEKTRVTVGRSFNCDITITDPTVSREHLVLHVGTEVQAENQGTNPAVIDGMSLATGEIRMIASGSVIVLGETTCIFQAMRPRSSRPLPLFSDDGLPVVVRDAEMHRIFGVVQLVAPTRLGVLILGETGTGKEVVAASIHQHSDRAHRKLVKLNCAALPSSLLERELFGNERGAFTGADERKIGIFEAAAGGTLFLDEVAEMPIATQAKLLRSVETQEVTRVGGVAPIKVDVRIIAATNRPLLSLTERGLFRSDLYYRLNGTTIVLPPLRRRRGEILPLAAQFVRAAAKRANKPVPTLDGLVEEMLLRHDWPGNVRELRNAMDRATALCLGKEIRAEDLPPDLVREVDRISRVPVAEAYAPSLPIPPNPAPNFAGDRVPDSIRPVRRSEPAGSRRSQLPGELEDAKGRLEKARILEALAEAHGHQAKAASILGISRRTLINKMVRYQIQRPRGRSA